MSKGYKPIFVQKLCRPEESGMGYSNALKENPATHQDYHLEFEDKSVQTAKSLEFIQN